MVRKRGPFERIDKVVMSKKRSHIAETANESPLKKVHCYL